MRVGVIGAGIVGVTTAHALAQEGHEVDVFDRCSSVAAESSFANAGVMAPAYVAPLAAPGLPRWLLRQLWQGDPAVRLRPGMHLASWRWLAQAWQACRAATAYQANRKAMVALSQVGLQQLDVLTQHLKLSFEQSEGLMVLFRERHTLKHLQQGLPLLEELGIAPLELSSDEARAREPGLCASTPIEGAWFLPGSRVANCRQVAQLLKDAAEQRGARFHFRSEIAAIHPGTRPTLVIRPAQQDVLDRTSALPTLAPASQLPSHTFTLDAPAPLAADTSLLDEHRFDAIVLCAGIDSARLLQALGTRLPLQPVFGYTLSAPVRSPERAPLSAVIDERHRITISRLGNRIRVAGGAELGGWAHARRPESIALLHRVLNDWFAGAAQTTQAQVWRGARPTLPDGPPLIGPSPHAGLWLNLGHGASGWALSMGSAQVLADLMAQREPGIDAARFRMDRWQRGMVE